MISTLRWMWVLFQACLHPYHVADLHVDDACGHIRYVLYCRGSCHREQTPVAAAEKDLPVPVKEPLQKAAASVRPGPSLATSEWNLLLRLCGNICGGKYGRPQQSNIWQQRGCTLKENTEDTFPGHLQLAVEGLSQRHKRKDQLLTAPLFWD